MSTHVTGCPCAACIVAGMERYEAKRRADPSLPPGPLSRVTVFRDPQGAPVGVERITMSEKSPTVGHQGEGIT